MSEYQYYEFQAIDRPLTASEMAELRSWSSRARITSTSFVNDYEWGEFKGDENAWMDKYFDAFLYFANWGTNVLKLRLPTRLLDRDTLEVTVTETATRPHSPLPPDPVFWGRIRGEGQDVQERGLSPLVELLCHVPDDRRNRV